MDVGTILSVAQTLLAALDCDQLKHICSTAGYKSQLDQLRATVVRIKAVLKDAESKQQLSEQEQLYVEELKDAVYEADDLFDEFVTLAERNKLSKGIKVRVLSLFTKFGTAYNMSQGVMKIKNRLDAIAYDKRFELSIDPKPVRDRRPETCSYVYEADIIGRELDLEKIVGVLLDQSNVQQDVSFLSIVGIGGLGKTALAQLVYNDARVKTTFPMTLWTCVADEYQELLDVKGVLGKILASATDHMINDGYTMDGLQMQLREMLGGKKFLLVLDDVWTEDPCSWHNLIQFMMGGQSGSWIVVTTRSRETVRIIGDGSVHNLSGLSKENSWYLFRKVAFGSHHSDVPEDLVKIGEDVVEGCANVPLAIRVVGSLLYGQDKQKWLSIQKMGLANIKESQNSIMSILKLSYHKLESPLKSCFSYCAIFPKDYMMKKDTLIRLWMAHGYIPLDGLQSPEVLGEEYFFILLRRCFFQDVKKDEVGDIESCKIHDLMHDLAQQVVGKEICRVKNMNVDLDKKVRHLSHVSTTNFSFTRKNRIRSYLDVSDKPYEQIKVKMDQICVDALAGNWKYLRALDLSRLKINSLPCSIGELIHLRYLDLSYNRCLEVLPKSITNLYNLLTLKLRCCMFLKELSKDMWKLVKLRALDLYECNRLSYMPRGMGKLSCLHNLTWFVVGGTSSSIKDVFDGLKDLKDLSELRGSLTIRIPFRNTVATSCKINNCGIEGGCLGNKEHLTSVCISFDYSSFSKEGSERLRVEYDEAVMEELQPLNNSKLKSLVVSRYCGVRMPCWPREDNMATFLPNLVKMEFSCCRKLQNLGKIRLPRLKMLCIRYCENLIAVLECPALEDLKLEYFNERLEIVPISGSSPNDIGSKLRYIRINNVSWLNSLPMNPFHESAKLFIESDKVESLGEAREGFRSCSSSLKYLEISYCRNLKRVVSEGLEHLSALEYLQISDCNRLSESEEVEGVSFCQSLRTLELIFLPQLVELPNWIQCLTSLQILRIYDCKGVKSMPNWMSKLTSVRELEIVSCSQRLYERCQESAGEDWPHIQHIPHISIGKHDDILSISL